MLSMLDNGRTRRVAGIGQVLGRTDAAAFKISQRITTTGGTNNLGIGTTFVPITLTAAQPIYATVQVRTRDATTLATLQDWRTVATNVAAGSPTLSVTGIDARLGWHLLDLRVNGDNSTIVLGANKQGMGRLVALSGQSLGVRMAVNGDTGAATIASQSVSISPNCSIYFGFSETGNPFTSVQTWSPPADGSPANGTHYNSAGGAELLRLQVAASGVNCGLVGYCQGATAIAQFVPSGTVSTALRANLAAVGGFEAFLWYQGHADAVFQSSSVYYQQQLTALFTDMTAQNVARGLSFDKIIATIPNQTVTGLISGFPLPSNVIRGAAETWAAANSATNVLLGDLDLFDGIHPTQTGAVTAARHLHRAFRPGLGFAHGDVGPQLVSATRATGSKSIAITVSLPSGATALSSVGNPAKRFSVFAAGTSSAAASSLALDATTPITISGTTITLLLAALPADSTALDVLAYFPLDPNNTGAVDNIYDNNTDGDGLTTGRQLRGTLGSGVRVAAPNGTVPTILTHVGPDLRTTTPTYTTGGLGSGSRLTGGYLYSYGPGDVMDTSQTFTIEARLTFPATTTSLKVALSGESKFYIGVSSGTLVANVNNNSGGSVTLSGPTINDAVERHVALVVTPTGAKLYVNGVQQATASFTPTTLASTNSFNIGTYSQISNFAWPTGGAIDEVAVWSIAKYATGFTSPTTAYVGSETGMVALYHLDGNGNAATY